MDLVIFGAGASLGAALGDAQPPLVRDLLPALKEFAPKSWGALSAEQEQAFLDDFETGMSLILQAAHGEGPTFKWVFPLEGGQLQWSELQWDLAAFFFRFEHLPGSLYERFLRRIKDAGALPRVCFATLNYERLLGLAANALNTRCHVGRDGRPEDVRLCLPHGASFIAPAAKLSNTSKGLQLGGKGTIELAGLGPIMQLNTSQVQFLRTAADFEESRKDDSLYPPVMSYIEPEKFAASGGGFIARQRSILQEWIAAADRIVLVGVRVHPGDRHFWEPLARASGRILYVAPSAGEFTAWAASVGRQGDPAPLAMTWSEAFDPICEYLEI